MHSTALGLRLADDRPRPLGALRATEEESFVATHPRSAELAAEAQDSLLAGVPMPWMTRWAGAFPVFVDDARGARFTDVDGHEYVDLCLGDTGAMTGHALPAVADAVAGARPSTASPRCCRAPTPPGSARSWRRRFGLPRWQFAMSATDANRFVLRFARFLTGRPKICVMDWCYHGTVDETLAVLDGDRVVPGPARWARRSTSRSTTRVVPFNDVEALDRALAHGDVAASCSWSRR